MQISTEAEKLEKLPGENNKQTRLTLLYGGIFLLVVVVFVVFAYLMKARENTENELKSSNLSYSQRIANLQSDNDWLSAENERLNIQIVELSASISDLQSTNQLNNEQLSILEAEKDSLLAQIADLNEQISDLNAQIEELRSALATQEPSTTEIDG